VGQVESHFVLSGDSVNLKARYVHGLSRTYHKRGNHFGRTQWYSYVTWVKWKLVLVHLKTELILMQDRYTVCAERAIGSKIIFGAPDRTPRCHGFVEARFSIFGDSVNVSARLVHVCTKHTISSEIILDAPDSTPT
jgi:hypothetical protein